MVVMMFFYMYLLKRALLYTSCLLLLLSICMVHTTHVFSTLGILIYIMISNFDIYLTADT